MNQFLVVLCEIMSLHVLSKEADATMYFQHLIHLQMHLHQRLIILWVWGKSFGKQTAEKDSSAMHKALCCAYHMTQFVILLLNQL